mgnify:CR=1 FL=1
MTESEEKYRDILNLPHHQSKVHPQMSIYDRAAQFSPFAALTGHEAAIKETARLTEEQVELDEDKQEELNEKLQTLIAYATEHPTVSVTYFKPDDKKTGGEYVTATGIFQKFRDYERTIVLEDGTGIDCDRIVEIRGIKKEIEEIFFRLNNSTPLTKSQVAKAKVGVEIAELINELLTTKFFTTSCNFSKAQLKASDDQKVLIQGMMLLDTNNVSDFELKDFSENSILEYSESIREKYSDKQCNILKSAIQYLTDAFPEKNKQLRKISIPMLVYLADAAMDKEIKPMYFRQWYEYFTQEDELMEVYKTFCSSGSTKLEKIKGRMAVMTESFCNYLELEIPEELKDLVDEVKEKLAAKEESEEMLSDGVSENTSKEMQGNTEEELPIEELPSKEDLDVEQEETPTPSECNSDGSENYSFHDAV